MSGPEHYAETERLLKLVRDESHGGDTYDSMWVPVELLRTCMQPSPWPLPPRWGHRPTEGRAWTDVAGTRYSGGGTEPGPRH